ncbi:MAG: hypothetical protein ACREL9_05505 [Gemmatimonadales bacterium]
MTERATAAVLLTLPLFTASGQRLRPAIPTFHIEDRVRVWAWAEPEILGVPVPGIRAERVAGRLQAYFPGDSLTVRRTGLTWPPWSPRVRTWAWDRVDRIDVPVGRNVGGGVAGGAGAALGVAISLHVMDAFICRPWGGSCLPGFWKTTAYAAAVTVPVGAVVGYFSPRWKPVYQTRGR